AGLYPAAYTCPRWPRARLRGLWGAARLIKSKRATNNTAGLGPPHGPAGAQNGLCFDMKKTQISRFHIHDDLTAPEGSVPVLKGALATGGQLPNFLGVLAGSPAAPRAYARFR